MAKAGRRGKYEEWITEDGCLRIKGWARDGLTDEEIAHNMGIGVSTFYAWQNRFIEIREAVKQGKAPCDTLVEDALYKAALSGNITAQIFWLKNRRTNRWRDAWKEEKGDNVVTIKLDNSVKDFCK